MNGALALMIFLAAGSAILIYSLKNRFRIRELEHKETLAALEKGAELPTRQTAPWTTRTYLLHGMIWLFSGLAAMVALFGLAVTSSRPTPVAQKLQEVNTARMNGATPDEIQLLLHEPPREERTPIGLGLLGLIPVGVGMAYLIFYRVENRKLIN